MAWTAAALIASHHNEDETKCVNAVMNVAFLEQRAQLCTATWHTAKPLNKDEKKKKTVHKPWDPKYKDLEKI